MVKAYTEVVRVDKHRPFGAKALHANTADEHPLFIITLLGANSLRSSELSHKDSNKY